MSSVCSRNREEASVATTRWARAEGGRQGWPRRLPSGSSSVKSLGLFSERGGPTGRMHSFIPLPESLLDPHRLRFFFLSFFS